MRKTVPVILTILAFLLSAGAFTTVGWAQLPVSYAGITVGMDEALVYNMLEKNGWPYVMEKSQALRIRLNNDYVDCFSLYFIARKVHRIQIVYKPGIENYGSVRFPEMEGMLIKKYGKYKDRSHWSTLNDQGESISHVRWVWESGNSRLEFRGVMSDMFDRPGYAVTESHLYSCEIMARDVEVQLERSRKQITNLEKLP
jgi:hypothetical protein